MARHDVGLARAVLVLNVVEQGRPPRLIHRRDGAPISDRRTCSECVRCRLGCGTSHARRTDLLRRLQVRCDDGAENDRH
jgi:hypothetical protein